MGLCFRPDTVYIVGYVAAVFDIITSCECEGHFYADDILSVVSIR